MPLIIGLDLGTTTITAVALDTDTSQQRGCASRPNQARLPSAPERSEWDIVAMAETACECLRDLSGQLIGRTDLAGLGITGQQHGMLLVDRELRPLTPFINWQDRRAERQFASRRPAIPSSAKQDMPNRMGCQMAAGYMGATLWWLRKENQLPANATALFATDYMTALLTGSAPFTDPTCAASSGVFDIIAGEWAETQLAMMQIPREVFPPIKPSGTPAGGLTAALAEKTGFPAGLPIFAGIGDNQASFLGGVADHANSVLVNVGTGGQVAVWCPALAGRWDLETRPFPLEGFLVVSAGLIGGAAYATLERFFAAVITQVGGLAEPADLFGAMNRLAAGVPAGCNDLVSEPFFAGTRAEPDRKAHWMRLALANFTPGHLARSVLEGMVKVFAASRDRIGEARGQKATTLVGAGNGIRANPLLGRILGEKFALPLHVSTHREEAACGAARLAAVRAGLFSGLADSAKLVRLALM